MSDRRYIIAIPTFNRVRDLMACLTCLQEARGLERYRIFIRDDASREFGVQQIAQLIPQAERIERNAANLGPDANQLQLFRDCLQSGAARVLVLDSDTIVSPSMLEFAEQAFDRTDGFLGLYNSWLHAKRGDIDSDLIEKWSAGGVATLWDAELLGRVIDRSERDAKRTWDYSAITELHASGGRVIVSRRSYAQHLGIQGVNNGFFGHIDYGRGFMVETEGQAQAMAVAFDDLMIRQRRFLQREKKEKKGIRRLLDKVRRKLR